MHLKLVNNDVRDAFDNRLRQMDKLDYHFAILVIILEY
jgi:hypothetical protein